MKKKSLDLILIFSFFVFLQGCGSIQSASSEKQISPAPAPTASVPANSALNKNLNNSVKSDDEEDVGEIKSCSPEKIYRGESINVLMKTPHGIYAAIRRLKDDKWFFLYGAKKNDPAWNDSLFTKLEVIKINTETAFNSTNVDVGEKPEKIFTETGKYRIMVSHEDFGQDDPPWTGMCEVLYVNEKRTQ